MLLDRDVDNRLVGGAAGIVGHIDFLEETEVTDALLRPAHLRGVEGVALYQAEFPTNHLIQRSNVAADIDALDVNARSLLHLVGDIDRAVLGMPRHFRLDVDEGEASIAQRICQFVDAALDFVGVVSLPLPGDQQCLQYLRLYVLQLIDQINLAELVSRAFLDCEGDVEAVARRGELRHGRDDAEVRIAFREIELAQELAVISQPVGIVDVVAAEKAIPARLACTDDPLEAAHRELVRADEIDGSDAG